MNPNKKIKVLHIVNRFNLGGLTFITAYLTRFMPNNFESLIIGGEKDDSEESCNYIFNQLGIKPIVIPEMKRSININNDKIAYQKIVKIIKEFKPDVVHTHASKAGSLGRIAASKCKVPVIVHTFHGHVFHSYFNKPKTLLIKTIEKYLARKSTAIIAISDIQKKELSSEFKICKASKIHVVPYGFDLTKFSENQSEKRISFRKNYLLDDDEIAIGIIGRLVPIKNHVFFLDAISSVLNKTRKKVRVFIIGDGEERNNLIAKCQLLNLDCVEFIKSPKKSDVTFTSWIKDVDIAIAGLDIIALTSLNEGTPVSLIEAQAANKPIVTTNVGGVENVIVKNQTAFVLEINDTNGFSNALLNLVENENLRIDMGKKGWENVNQKFNITRMINDMQNVYVSLLNNTK
ncbi:MAG: glycosyltransferase [Flavobacteriales bacterium]|nr:glycosyltransferase [Flavobacteriales bacterium]